VVARHRENWNIRIRPLENLINDLQEEFVALCLGAGVIDVAEMDHDIGRSLLDALQWADGGVGASAPVRD
jgi:hypothetical protein